MFTDTPRPPLCKYMLVHSCAPRWIALVLHFDHPLRSGVVVVVVVVVVGLEFIALLQHLCLTWL